jgi:CMP-N,N'-diacetyllegionaminic acid synthase
MKSRLAPEDLVAIVPVRAGSKGLPGKNTMHVAGTPLYMHAVGQGLRTIGQVLISTDIAEIETASLPSGCSLCKRPAELAADDAPMDAVIGHIIEECGLSGKTLVLLQATSPMRIDSDIVAALELFETRKYDMVLSVVERDKGVLKYGTLEGNRFTAMRSQRFCFFNRQQLDPVYGPNGAVYVFDANRFTDSGGFPCEKIGAVVMPVERSVDIDTLADLRNVENQMMQIPYFVQK